MKIQIERWKWNKEYGLYVSTLGHFHTAHKRPANTYVKNNYIYVYAYGEHNTYISAHRIVMKTWAKRPQYSNMTVEHIDHNTRNNALSNLEWITRDENQRRANQDAIAPTELVPSQTMDVQTHMEEYQESIKQIRKLLQSPLSAAHKDYTPAFATLITQVIQQNGISFAALEQTRYFVCGVEYSLAQMLVYCSTLITHDPLKNQKIYIKSFGGQIKKLERRDARIGHLTVEYVDA